MSNIRRIGNIVLGWKSSPKDDSLHAKNIMKKEEQKAMTGSDLLDKELLGKLMRRHREADGRTQSELALTLGWHKQTISDIETGKAASLEKIFTLASELCISLDEIARVVVRRK